MPVAYTTCDTVSECEVDYVDASKTSERTVTNFVP